MSLGDELMGLLGAAAGEVLSEFSPADQNDLKTYAHALADLLIERQETDDPVAVADLDRRIGNYKNAIGLMADKYKLAASDEGSKALMGALELIAEKAIAVVLAALAA